MKPTSGYLATLGIGPIQWKSKRQPTVAQSTAEAALIGATKAFLGLIHLSGNRSREDPSPSNDDLAYYRGPFTHTATLFCDSPSAT